jgi:archaellum biogenesis ATPase FlaH
MTTIEKILYYLFNEYYLRMFNDQGLIKLVTDFKAKTFINYLISFYKKYGALPKQNEFDTFIKGDSNYDEYMLWFVKYPNSSVGENFNFLVDVLRQEYAKVGLDLIVQESKREKFDLPGLTSKVSKLRDDIEEDLDIRSAWVYEDIDDRIHRIEDAKHFSYIPSGLNQFDKYVGGFDKGRLYLIFGRTGAGKSKSLFTFAYNLSLQGYAGLYFTFEMPIEEMNTIYDTRAGSISVDNFRNGTVDMEYYKDVLEKIQTNKYPLKWAEHTKNPTVDYIQNEINEFKRHRSIDFIAVDYLGLMYNGQGEEKDVLGEITRRLKNIAKREKIIVLTAQQANRKSKEKGKDGKETEVGTENISGSDKIGANCDFIAYVSQGKLDKGILNMDILKNRCGPKDRTIKMLADFPTNTIKDAIEFNNIE